MKLPRNLKCLQNVSIPFCATWVDCVSFNFSYNLSSRVCLLLSLSCFDLTISGSVLEDGVVWVIDSGSLKNPKAGKNIASVLEFFCQCRYASVDHSW